MFSVVVPVYNHKAFVEQAVASAAQSDLVHEILIVDDFSTDGSAELIARFPRRFGSRVRILRDKEKSNKGAHMRLNQLCAAASGHWLSILNSDDLYTPERFDIACGMIERGCTFITGALMLINEHASVIGAKRGNLDPDYALPEGLRDADLNIELNLFHVLCSENMLLTTSNMIVAKSLFDELGGFRDLRYCHDWDFALRACLAGRPGFSHAPLTRYRIHAANTIQEPTPHVDGEAIRLFARLCDEYPWVMEDRLAVEALRGNRHLGGFVSDAEIGRAHGKRHHAVRGEGRPRCLVVIAEDGDDVEARVEALKDSCDIVTVEVGRPGEDDGHALRALEQARQDFAPDLAWLCGGFGWFARNARAVRRIFGGVPVIDDHELRDVGAWRGYYRLPAIQSFDRFTAESAAAADLLAAGSGIPRNRIDVLPPVAGQDGLGPVVPRRGEGHIFLGALSDDVSALALLDIARRCRDQGLPDRFLLAMSGGVPDRGLRFLSAAMLDNIAPAAADAIGEADAVIALSPSTGLSAAVAALSAGRPVLGTATGEMKRLLDGGAGMTVPPAADAEKTWQGFMAFRKALVGLQRRAADGRVKLRAHYGPDRRREAVAMAMARALRQAGRRDCNMPETFHGNE